MRKPWGLPAFGGVRTLGMTLLPRGLRGSVNSPNFPLDALNQPYNHYPLYWGPSRQSLSQIVLLVVRSGLSSSDTCRARLNLFRLQSMFSTPDSRRRIVFSVSPLLYISPSTTSPDCFSPPFSSLHLPPLKPLCRPCEHSGGPSFY